MFDVIDEIINGLVRLPDRLVSSSLSEKDKVYPVTLSVITLAETELVLNALLARSAELKRKSLLEVERLSDNVGTCVGEEGSAETEELKKVEEIKNEDTKNVTIIPMNIIGKNTEAKNKEFIFFLIV